MSEIAELRKQLRDAIRAEKLTVNQALGRRIRDVRKQAGISQGELAEMTTLSRTSINKVEHGTQVASFDSVFQIANALGLTISSFTIDLEQETRNKAARKWNERK